MPLSVVTLNSQYTVATWTSLTKTTATGDPVALSQFSDKTVQVVGDLSGSTFELQGSMDGTNWVPLTKDGTAPINGIGLFWIWENPRFIRPKLPVPGAGTPSITVLLGMSTQT